MRYLKQKHSKIEKTLKQVSVDVVVSTIPLGIVGTNPMIDKNCKLSSGHQQKYFEMNMSWIYHGHLEMWNQTLGQWVLGHEYSLRAMAFFYYWWLLLYNFPIYRISDSKGQFWVEESLPKPWFPKGFSDGGSLFCRYLHWPRFWSKRAPNPVTDQGKPIQPTPRHHVEEY